MEDSNWKQEGNSIACMSVAQLPFFNKKKTEENYASNKKSKQCISLHF